jgi:hypothetical protein
VRDDPVEHHRRTLAGAVHRGDVGLHHDHHPPVEYVPTQCGRLRRVGREPTRRAAPRRHAGLHDHLAVAFPRDGHGRCQPGFVADELRRNHRHPGTGQVGEVALVEVPADQPAGVVERREVTDQVEPGHELVESIAVVPGAAHHDQVEHPPLDLRVVPGRPDEVHPTPGEGVVEQRPVGVIDQDPGIGGRHQRHPHGRTVPSRRRRPGCGHLTSTSMSSLPRVVHDLPFDR